MKKRNSTSALTLTAAILAVTCANSVQAGTIASTTIAGVTSTVVDISGKEGYGYFSTANIVNNGFLADGSNQTDGNFSALTNQTVPTPAVLTTVVGIYNPFVDDLRPASGAQAGSSALTFNGNASYGGNGGYGVNAGNLFSLTFTDLAAGDYIMSYYYGHSSDGRSFNWEANLTGATVDNESAAFSSLTNLASSSTGNYNMAFYTIAFTAAANDDLTLTFSNGAGGGTGGGVFSGYTVDFTAVPEPRAALLGGLGLLALLRRRR